MLIYILKDLLEFNGLKYIEKDGGVQLALLCGEHRLEIVFKQNGVYILCCYIRYPWKISENSLSGILRPVNEKNASLSLGSFMVSGNRLIFRCGAYICDEYTARESIYDLFVRSAATADGAWNYFAAALAVRNGDGEKNER